MERQFHLSPLHSIDNYFRLHYGEGLTGILEPLKEITDGDLCLGIVANNSLHPRRLLLLEKDREPIRVSIPETQDEILLRYPGKSAVIHLDKSRKDRGVAQEAVEGVLGSVFDRRDHFHFATVNKITSVGWHAYFAPLQMERKILHARLVAERTIVRGEDPTEDDAERLAAVFSKLC